jgi:hypothetical protein
MPRTSVTEYPAATHRDPRGLDAQKSLVPIRANSAVGVEAVKVERPERNEDERRRRHTLDAMGASRPHPAPQSTLLKC